MQEKDLPVNSGSEENIVSDLNEEINVPEEETVMKFRDEDGNTVELEIAAKIYLGETEYLILRDSENEDDEFLFRTDFDSEGNPEYNAVENDEEFNEVKKEYAKLLYNEN